MDEAVLYVVRIWANRTPGRGFRATVRRIESEHTRDFNQLDALARYFAGTDTDQGIPTQLPLTTL